jgi:5-methyltetrahydropteroyltriglutamate--homocysteine methyltransferase
MMRSIDRFLTTHTGSLPRPDDLVRIMYAKEEGQAVDRAELATHIRDAVARVVAQQKEAGIDIINDGEMSKPSLPPMLRIAFPGSAVPATHSSIKTWWISRTWLSAFLGIQGDPGGRPRLVMDRSHFATPKLSGPISRTSHPQSAPERVGTHSFLQPPRA